MATTAERQATFDRVFKRMEAQGWQRSVKGILCRYRSPDGKVCGAGALIPDDLYSSGMEGQDITGVLNEYPKLQRYFTKENFDHHLVIELQAAHDRGFHPEQMQRLFAGVARYYGLKV